MGALPKDLEACCDSVSCLHALEHFGLGRYGDPVDPDGWKTGFDNLCAMLKVGGRLYLSVPIGCSRVEFNSQRVFSAPFLLNMFAADFVIEEMAVVTDQGILKTHVDWRGPEVAGNFDCRCGCGIVVAQKTR